MVILKSFKVGTVTLASTLLLAASAIASSVYGLYTIRSLHGRLEYTTTNTVPSLSSMGSIDGAVGDVRVSIAKHFASRNEGELRARGEELLRQVAVADKLLADYAPLVSDEHEKQLYDEVVSAWGSYKTTMAKVDSLVDAGRQAEALNEFNDRLDPLGKHLDDTIGADKDFNNEMAVKSGAAASTMASDALMLLACLGGLVLATLVMAIAILRNRLAGPLDRLHGAMAEMAGGDLDRAIPGTDLMDEIGAISNALGAIKAGVSARTREEADRQAAVQAGVVSALADALGKFKNGRLDCRIDQAFPEDYESLRIDFNEMVETLAGIIADVSSAANSVKTGSSEIASAASDLSTRTASQAGAIEETAASVRQLNAGVGDAAQTAEQVSRDAGEAESVDGQSSEVMTEAVGAMEEISRSSAQMEAIVALIDGIAFQTNLLALNAGVEAARAGEAGKGFAVVASEVRSLAQRASEAARDITGIIKSSGANVSRGVSLITRTQEGLGQIHSRISSVARMIDSIASNSREQASTIAQIDIAIGEMDGMTQQNAALVEESTAASRSLADEAHRLERLMGRFSGVSVSRPSGSAAYAPSAAVPAAVPALPLRAPAPRPVAASHRNAAVAEDWSEF